MQGTDLVRPLQQARGDTSSQPASRDTDSQPVYGEAAQPALAPHAAQGIEGAAWPSPVPYAAQGVPTAVQPADHHPAVNNSAVSPCPRCAADAMCSSK